MCYYTAAYDYRLVLVRHRRVDLCAYDTNPGGKIDLYIVVTHTV